MSNDVRGNPHISFMPHLKEIVSKETYEVFAGVDWPRYEDFITGEYTVSDNIKKEIDELVINQNQKNISNQTENRHWLMHIRFWFVYFLPAMCGLIGFIALGGTLTKFLIVGIVCVYLNQFYNHTVHKWLTHRQFVPKWYIRPLMLWSITLVGNYRLKWWVLVHKLHHRYSDTSQDPQLASVGVYRLMAGIFPNLKINPLELKFNERVHLPWKDVRFVNKYQHVLYCVNFIVLCLIDLQTAFLSLFVLRFYAIFYSAVSNYIIHSKEQGVAVNLPWYWEFWFFGECLHKDHHARPSKFDLSKPGRIEPSAKFWKYFATNIKN